MRKSVFGSLKKRFGLDDANNESSSTPTASTSRSVNATASASTNNTNPFRATAPPTRRPAAEEPPPTYTEAVATESTEIPAHRFTGAIDILFLNYNSNRYGGKCKAQGGYYNVTNVNTVTQIFNTVRPSGATPTGTRINNILRPYLRHYEQKWKANQDEDPDVKPVNLIVITDGAPTDDLEGVLINAAEKLDRMDAPSYQVGIQFFQVGNEPGARQHLQELDDNLSKDNSVRDMVDTVTWDSRSSTSAARRSAGLTADGILKVVLGAVVKRLDRRPTGRRSSASLQVPDSQH